MDGSRHRRECRVDIPRGRVDGPRHRRGCHVDIPRGRVDELRHRRGCHVDIPPWMFRDAIVGAIIDEVVIIAVRNTSRDTDREDTDGNEAEQTIM